MDGWADAEPEAVELIDAGDLRIGDVLRDVRGKLEPFKGDYQAVEKRSGGVRMSADDLREAVEDWGMALAPPPADGWWERATVTPIDDRDPPQFHVAAPMWQPDGESDISLELTLRQVSEDEFEVEVDNLHML